MDDITICAGEGLAGHAERLSTMDERNYLENIGVPMLILAPWESTLAPLDGKRSQRKLHDKVAGSKLKVNDLYRSCRALSESIPRFLGQSDLFHELSTF